jgi:hypothetical protein
MWQEMRCTGFLWGDLMERDHFEDLVADARITLKWICKKWDGEAWTGSLWLRVGQVAHAFKCGNEPWGSIKCGEFLGWLRTGQLLRKDCAAWCYLHDVIYCHY